MVREVNIRRAAGADLQAINDIYNYYVSSSTCTFETIPETLKMREAWFAAHGLEHPVLIAEYGGKIAGWAALTRYRPRPAYRHTVEDSIYIHTDLLGMGIGTLLLEKLITEAEKANHHSIVALIAADQPGSIRLHEKCGFTEVGRIKEAGQKFSRWIDVIYMQRMV